jgi:hypothetical protein
MVIRKVELRAVSLAVVAFSREGEKVFEGTGGLDLVERIHSPGGPTLEHELHEDLFVDPTYLRDGVAIALDPLIAWSR